jgi:hypothetical protein
MLIIGGNWNCEERDEVIAEDEQRRQGLSLRPMKASFICEDKAAC